MSNRLPPISSFSYSGKTKELRYGNYGSYEVVKYSGRDDGNPEFLETCPDIASARRKYDAMVLFDSDEKSDDLVNHPRHYEAIGGHECIDITRWLSYDVGCAVKYFWRRRRKGNELQDLEKCLWFLNDVIEWNGSLKLPYKMNRTEVLSLARPTGRVPRDFEFHNWNSMMDSVIEACGDTDGMALDSLFYQALKMGHIGMMISIVKNEIDGFTSEE